MQLTDSVPPTRARQAWPETHVVLVDTPRQVTVPQEPVAIVHLPDRHEAWVWPVPGQFSYEQRLCPTHALSWFGGDAGHGVLGPASLQPSGRAQPAEVSMAPSGGGLHSHTVQPFLSTGLPYAHFMGGQVGHPASVLGPVSPLGAVSRGGGMLSMQVVGLVRLRQMKGLQQDRLAQDSPRLAQVPMALSPPAPASSAAFDPPRPPAPPFAPPALVEPPAPPPVPVVPPADFVPPAPELPPVGVVDVPPLPVLPPAAGAATGCRGRVGDARIRAWRGAVGTCRSPAGRENAGESKPENRGPASKQVVVHVLTLFCPFETGQQEQTRAPADGDGGYPPFDSGEARGLPAAASERATAAVTHACDRRARGRDRPPRYRSQRRDRPRTRTSAPSASRPRLANAPRCACPPASVQPPPWSAWPPPSTAPASAAGAEALGKL
jgi:hypothetical protein